MLGLFGTLLGGVLKNRAEKRGIAEQNAYNDPSAIRARYEAAGFNPLLGIGPGVDTQKTAASGAYLGDAIANGALLLADDLASKRQVGAQAALERTNEKLQQRVEQLTLRPKVGGIYARRETTPSLATALGASNGAPDRAGAPPVYSDMGGWDTTGLAVLGNVVDPNPNFSDAERIEARYGDIASWVYGLGAVAGDAWHNRGKIPSALGWEKAQPLPAFPPLMTRGYPLTSMDHYYVPGYPQADTKAMAKWPKPVRRPVGFIPHRVANSPARAF